VSAIEIAHTFSLAEHHDGFRQVVAQESKNVTIDERNLTSTQWVEYHNGTKRAGE